MAGIKSGIQKWVLTLPLLVVGFSASGENIRPESYSSHIYGSHTAPYSVISYMDLHCVFCRNMYPKLRKLVNKSDGQIKWEFKHYFLETGDPAYLSGALAAECVAKTKGENGFWRFIQAYTGPSFTADFPPQRRLELSIKKLGLQQSDVQSCTDNKTYHRKVMEEYKEGLSLEFKGTPGFMLVNNKTGNRVKIQGEQDSDKFKKLLFSLN